MEMSREQAEQMLRETFKTFERYRDLFGQREDDAKDRAIREELDYMFRSEPAPQAK